MAWSLSQRQEQKTAEKTVLACINLSSRKGKTLSFSGGSHRLWVSVCDDRKCFGEKHWFARTLLCLLLQQMYRGCSLMVEVRTQLLNQIVLAHGGWVWNAGWLSSTVTNARLGSHTTCFWSGRVVSPSCHAWTVVCVPVLLLTRTSGLCCEVSELGKREDMLVLGGILPFLTVHRLIPCVTGVVTQTPFC